MPTGERQNHASQTRASRSRLRRLKRLPCAPQVDSQGAAHEAVIGVERESRDAHYSYRKSPNFKDGPPLMVSNISPQPLIFYLFALSLSVKYCFLIELTDWKEG